MILADKIAMLRKKAGGSQEELSEKLGVSRQAVSKWESAQSVPDLNKILLLSRTFGVSTDYLLRDECEEPEGEAEPEVLDDQGEKLLSVSLGEANAFLALKRMLAPKTAFGVFLCILSSVPLLLLTGAQKMHWIRMTEGQASGFGVALLLVLVAGGVFLFVAGGMRREPYEGLRRESLDTAYGVEGLVRERREAFRDARNRGLAAGVLLCILSAIPVLLMEVLPGAGRNAMLSCAGVSLLPLLVGIGVFEIVFVSGVWESFQVLLEEGAFSRANKRSSRRYGGVYWSLVTALYLLVSFLTGAWQSTWVVWPVAGVLWAVVCQLLGLREDDRDSLRKAKTDGNACPRMPALPVPGDIFALLQHAQNMPEYAQKPLGVRPPQPL
ncbi:MAG: helix-turn-helix transcriptional regulator [Firmicutes bacterium]|nr:helix-turn-helix transcriptional regulator [Bacillota bacterium]